MKQVPESSRFFQLWLALACGLVPAGLALGQGTIVYHQHAAPSSPLVGKALDLNGDGQPDVHFYGGSVPQANFYFTSASGNGSARLLVTPQGLQQSYLVGLGAGSLIGGPTNKSLFWAAQDAPNAYGQATALGAYIPEDVGGNLVPLGYFYGTTAFMGIQFQSESEWLYGWLRIRGGTAGVGDDGQFHLNPPAWILDWAYETRPDTPIFAGAVPEPSTWALMLGGGLLLVYLKRTTRNRHNGSFV